MSKNIFDVDSDGQSNTFTTITTGGIQLTGSNQGDTLVIGDTSGTVEGISKTGLINYVYTSGTTGSNLPQYTQELYINTLTLASSLTMSQLVQGDLIQHYGGTFERVPIGTPNQLLTVGASSNLVYQNLQSIISDYPTLTFNTISATNGNLINIYSTNASVVSIPNNNIVVSNYGQLTGFGIGSSGQYLGNNGTNLTWNNFATKNYALAIINGSTIFNLSSVAVGNIQYFPNYTLNYTNGWTTNGSQLTYNGTSGTLFSISSSFSMNSDTDNSAFVYSFFQNSNQYVNQGFGINEHKANDIMNYNFSTIIQCNNGDIIKLFLIRQSTGSNDGSNANLTCYAPAINIHQVN